MSANQPFTAINPNNPLTFKHLSDINAALAALATAQAQADMASSAGIDMTNQLATIASQRDQLLRIKQVYFPGQ